MWRGEEEREGRGDEYEIGEELSASQKCLQSCNESFNHRRS